jgi:hypothetical protein
MWQRDDERQMYDAAIDGALPVFAPQRTRRRRSEGSRG